MYLCFFSTSNLFNWKNNKPTYRYGSKRNRKFVLSNLATHNLIWAKVQSLVITLRMSEEWRMVLEEADKLLAGALANLVRTAAAMVVLVADPN